MFSLANKVALVTGAATGIGQIIAKTLVKAGANIAISDKPEANLDKTEKLCISYSKEIFNVWMDIRCLEQRIKGFYNNHNTI